MKVRNYEKNAFVIFLITLLILIELVFLIFILNNKIYKYEIISGTVIKDNLVVLIINDKQSEILNKNGTLYLNNKKIKYKIHEERGYLFKKNKVSYKEVLIKFKFDKKYKVNDNLLLVLKDKKINIYEMFKIIWDGD